MDINNQNINESIIPDLIEISIAAGESIMEHYESDHSVDIKIDGSPVTKADIESNRIIKNSLRKITPKIPIISEESSDISFSIRSKWEIYWLIDPLDGTKEFLNKNGEFTTNIALIINNKPAIGVVYSPISRLIFFGSLFTGSYRIDQSGRKNKLDANSTPNQSYPRIVVSRSHINEKTNEFLSLIGKHEIVKSGSSIKLCMVAENKADIYPRLGPTSEWDTAAGHAVAIYSGANVFSSSGTITYNTKSSYLNKSFLVTNEKYSDTLNIFKKLDKNKQD
mgnify:CR=1 FL=1|tara:strand:+ start:6352 stop:7188 length:837 start_codon:yes stop_codon:yes gene_type:complete